MATESLDTNQAAELLRQRLFPEPKDKPEKAAAAADPAAEPDPELESDPEGEPEETEAAGGGENAQIEGDDDPDAQPIQSLADLAARLEVSEEDLAKLLKVKGRDGQEIALHDVLESYRKPAPAAADLERSQARLAELEQERGAYQQATQQLAAQAQAFAARLKAQEPDWQKLQATNPNGYLAARVEWMEQVRQLEVADRQLQMARAREQEVQARQVAEFRRAEARKLQSQVPEWQDPKVFEGDLKKTEQYLLEKWKLAPEEVAQLADHRDWTIADKARRYDELMSKKPATAEKVRALPRLLAPGVASGGDRGKAAAAAKAEETLTARLKASGSAQDAAALIAQRIERQNKRAAARTLARRRV